MSKYIEGNGSQTRAVREESYKYKKGESQSEPCAMNWDLRYWSELKNFNMEKLYKQKFQYRNKQKCDSICVYVNMYIHLYTYTNETYFLTLLTERARMW